MKRMLALVILVLFAVTGVSADLVLPLTSVAVTQSYVGTSGSPNAYWINMFSSLSSPALGTGYSVLPNTPYLSWCVDVAQSPTSSTHLVTLYDTLDPPTGYDRVDGYQAAWNAISWLFNNRSSVGTGSGEASTYQKAIWTILYRSTPTYVDMNPAHNFYSNLTVKSMVDASMLGGTTYIRQPGDLAVVMLRNDGGQDTILTVETPPVPEPGTMVLLGVGLVGLVGYGVRKKKTIGG